MGRHAWDNLDKLKSMPTLLIAGEQDRNVSVPHMIRAAEQHPWIEFVRLPRSRHILTVEPDQTTAFEAILSFVNRSAIER
jgi:pimeloyl-ACP methyl ester carboxylesterase